MVHSQGYAFDQIFLSPRYPVKNRSRTPPTKYFYPPPPPPHGVSAHLADNGQIRYLGLKNLAHFFKNDKGRGDRGKMGSGQVGHISRPSDLMVLVEYHNYTLQHHDYLYWELSAPRDSQ